jgi:hypothetical protein
MEDCGITKFGLGMAKHFGRGVDSGETASRLLREWAEPAAGAAADVEDIEGIDAGKKTFEIAFFQLK